MSDELQMTDAVRMERAIIRIALLLAPDEAAVGVNFDELPGQVQALVAERDRLRAAIKAHHFDVAHTASKGIGVRASDQALYREAGLPDVGEADKETGAEFIARMEAIEAERNRLRAEVHRCGDLLAEWTSDLAAVRAERDRLRALVSECYAATFLGVRPSGEELEDLDPVSHNAVPAVIEAALRTAADMRYAAEAERDRLRAVVEAAVRTIEQAQFKGEACEVCNETYRVLHDESIAPVLEQGDAEEGT